MCTACTRPRLHSLAPAVSRLVPALAPAVSRLVPVLAPAVSRLVSSSAWVLAFIEDRCAEKQELGDGGACSRPSGSCSWLAERKAGWGSSGFMRGST